MADVTETGDLHQFAIGISKNGCHKWCLYYLYYLLVQKMCVSKHNKSKVACNTELIHMST